MTISISHEPSQNGKTRISPSSGLGGFVTVLFATAATLVGAPVSAANTGSASWNDWHVVWEFHTDLGIGYNSAADEWSFAVDRGEFGGTGTQYPPDSTILLATPETIRTVPDSIPSSFSFLGEPGDTYYLLPFSEPVTNSKILYLGANTYDVSGGVFTGNEVHWELAEIDGPGEFFTYQVQGGTPILYMDSRPEEAPFGPGFIAEVDGHFHFNWIFREPGIYVISFKASGELPSGETTSSDPTPFFFLVDPKPVEWWLVDQFRENVKSPEASLANDASGDNYANLLAYGLDYSPLGSAAEFLPKHEWVNRDGQTFLSLVFRKPEGDPERDDRSDLDYRVQTSDDLIAWADITDETAWETASPDADDTPRIRVIDTEPFEGTSRRFLRLVIEHQP